jgi:hypothetical protein
MLNATKTRATVNTPAVREAVNFYANRINDGSPGRSSSWRRLVR